MSRTPPLVLAALAAVTLTIALPSAEASPSRGGGGHRHGGHGHHGGGYAGWGWGLAVGVPWALGFYDPWYRSYPGYGYGAYYAPAPYATCEPNTDCWIERQAQAEPPAPTTQVPPPGRFDAPAGPAPAEGAPAQRPLHLNYCEASRAWFPAVTSCASGWRMTRPAYD
ncbi:MAG: hypothetical protein IPJ28_19010 [Betaproteobacteria bacterium]|nr:hypothetical protein [Betaproteobacteria bacterium]